MNTVGPGAGYSCRGRLRTMRGIMPARRRKPVDEATERRLASRELGRAKRSIGAIRNFYIANAILWGVPLALVLLVPGQVLLKAIFAAGFLFMVAGAAQVRNQPFVWSILIASIWTLYLASHVVRGGRLMSLGFLLSLGWTLGCWMMVPTTVRVNKLIAQHPDLWISKKMRPGGRLRRTGRRR